MLVHRLALALHRPVGELNVGVEELIDWIAFDQLHPFPAERTEYMLAQLCHLIASSYSKRPPGVDKFMMTTQLAQHSQRANTSFEDSVRAVFGAPKARD